MTTLHLNDALIDKVPGNKNEDLEAWLVSLTRQNVEFIFDMLYVDTEVPKLVGLAIRLYLNEMDMDAENFPEEDGRFAVQLFSRLIIELQKEAMIRLSILKKGVGRRKIYKDSNVLVVFDEKIL